MQRYEYRYIYQKRNTNDISTEEFLNYMGDDGWELVQIITAGGGDGTHAQIHAFVFKRPLKAF